MVEKQKPATNKAPLPPIARFVLAGVAIGLSYAAVSHAIDSGSLFSYTVAAILLGLGIKDLALGFKTMRKRSE